MSSCTDNEQMSKLSYINSLISTNTDSAVMMLNDMKDEAESSSEDVRIYYDFLCVKSGKEKNLKASDSLMSIVIYYYEQQNTEEHLHEAYYYAGKVNAELKNGEKALLYLHKALLCDSTMLTPEFTSMVYSQMGDVLMRNRLYEEAKNMKELALFYSRNAADTACLLECKADIRKIIELSDNDTIDSNKRTQKRLALQKINEKVKVDELKKQNTILKEKSDVGGASIVVVCTVILISALCIWLYSKKKRNNKDRVEECEIEKTDISVDLPSPTKKQFYDKEISELINTRAGNDKVLKNADWIIIEERITELMPTFKDSLYELINLSETEYHICILIKLGVSPSNMAKLMALSNSSVSQIRLRLQHKVFEGKGTAKDWDNYIQSL